MNLDKTIKELTNRLDVVGYPYSSSPTSNEIKNDGINYWKGKKIISAKKWNEIYEKNSIYTDNYRITLVSRKPLQYFPDDYNGSISSFNEELKEEAQKWNKEYYDLLEFRKNPILGRNKCSGCIFSTELDDPLFVGIGKVVARIVSNQCNNNNNLNYISNTDNDSILYPCRVMNFFQCPFESNNNNQYPYTKEELFTLQRLAFDIEQAISTFHEATKNNEIIYEVDFENDRVQEIHTNYNGEPYSWGWNENIKEQLSKVKPNSSTIQIINEQDIYNILTNKEKLECLFQEYENNESYRETEQKKVCYDENTPCVLNDDNNSNEKMMDVDTGDYNNNVYSHKGKNRHSRNNREEESDNEKLISNLKAQIKDELEEHKKEQQILLKENKQNIIDFLVDNKDSIKIQDLKTYEPIYKCYREKGNCHICNSLSNIICKKCSSNYKNEIWLCTSHWEQHALDSHE